MKENLSKKIAKAGHKLAEESVNSCCVWVFHVPEVPEKAKRLKRQSSK